jgi:hypothetical protein
MKTKLKTSPKSQNQSILENRNFLNSQNYILGKKEKKIILLKFFVEYHYKFLLMLLSLISDLIFS